MATKLDKSLTRETSVEIDNRLIQVSLNEDQTIGFKLKGMKSGEVTIGILELYNQLTGNKSKSDSIVFKHNDKNKNHNEPQINLNDLRSKIMISDMEYSSKAKLDEIIVDLLKNTK